MISAGAGAALDQLNEILALDGGKLIVEAATPTSLSLVLDLGHSECPECVLPKDLMLQMLRMNLAEHDPDIRDIELADPRENEV